MKLKADNIAQVVNAVVEHSGMRVYRLEQKSGVYKDTIRRWLCGKYSPRLDLFLCLCEAAGFEVEVRVSHVRGRETERA